MRSPRLRGIERATGAVVDEFDAPANDDGYRQALARVAATATATRVWAIQGSGSYGAGLTNRLQAARVGASPLVTHGSVTDSGVMSSIALRWLGESEPTSAVGYAPAIRVRPDALSKGLDEGSEMRTNMSKHIGVSARTAARPSSKARRLPPRWFVRLFWIAHRRVYRLARGRFGLWRAKPGKWGAMRVITIGRRSGREHAVMVGYIEDGPNLVAMAMNGWAAPDPIWWLNLKAHPDVTVNLKDGPRLMHARAATGDERERLWSRWREVDEGLDEFASRRPRETTVVVFEPRPRSLDTA